MQDLLNTYSPIQIVGVAIVVILLVKKLVKWALIIGLGVVAYHLYSTGALDGLLGTTGA
jgi:hypothetical protein